MGYLPLVEDEPVASHLKDLLEQRRRVVPPRSLIGQKFLCRHSVLRSAAKVHGDAVQRFRLDLAVALQDRVIVRAQLFDRLPQSLDLVIAVVGEPFNTSEKHHGRSVFDDQSVAIHPRRAAIAHHAYHPGIAAVIH